MTLKQYGIAFGILAVLILALIGANTLKQRVLLKNQAKNSQNQQPNNQPANGDSVSAISQNPPAQVKLISPIDRALDRVTKKPFGIEIAPNNSPVSPERFSGYHTGADFETFSEEQNLDIAISAVCAGKLLLKKFATGYGGVAVQACRLDNQDVTIIYGHLKLASIKAQVGDSLSAGDKLGVLGKGNGLETDGERKHLHLGIHKGTAIDLLGYVQGQADLNSWLDPLQFLK